MNETFYFGDSFRLEVSNRSFSVWVRKKGTASWKRIIDCNYDKEEDRLSINLGVTFKEAT